VPPLQALGLQQFVDPAPLDRDALLLVEVGLESVECPAAEGQAQPLGIGQRRGDDLGPLLGGVGVRPAGPGPLLQAGEPLVVEPADPGVDGGPGAALGLGDGGGLLAAGGGEDDPGAFDETGGCGAGVAQCIEGGLLLCGHRAERNLGGHGCASLKGLPLIPANHLPDAPLSRWTEVFAQVE
jgi:hypothetical protein